jgi:hypothetical protein
MSSPFVCVGNNVCTTKGGVFGQQHCLDALVGALEVWATVFFGRAIVLGRKKKETQRVRRKKNTTQQSLFILSCSEAIQATLSPPSLTPSCGGTTCRPSGQSLHFHPIP